MEMPVSMLQSPKKVFLLFGGVTLRPYHVWVNAELFTKPCEEEDKNGVLIIDITREVEYGKRNIVLLAIISRDGEPAGVYGPVKLATLKRPGKGR